MEIQLSPGEEKRICLVDGYENYLTLGVNKPESGEGLIYKNQVLTSDFCVLAEDQGYKRLWTRFDGARQSLMAGYGEAAFCGGKFKVRFSLLENALYFNCENFDKKSAALVLLPCIDLAKKLDKGQACCASVPLEVTKPLASELLQLTKTFGKKAAYARLLSFDKPCEIYISLEHSPSAATKAAARFLKENAFGRRQKEIEGLLKKTSFKSGDQEYDSALEWAKFSALQFLNKNKRGALWAGLPWFRDYWGRDIYLSVPGALLFSANVQKAQTLFENSAPLQDTNPRSVTYGRFPNIYRESGDSIYNTADATLLFVREVLESARFSGDKKFLQKMWPNVQLALECDRLIRCDSAGFLLHGDADTWMDARIFGEKSFCPRGNRANDIQVLWFTALKCGAEIARVLQKDNERFIWEAAAKKVKDSFLGKFFDGQKMADCVMRDESPDFRVRPNQLALVTVPKITGENFIPKEIEETVTRNAIGELLFPYGLCSLSQRDRFFHPYHKTWEWHHEDAAYHNGAIWTWNAGTAIGALCSAGLQDLAWKFAKNVAGQFFNGPCAGSLAANLWAYPDQDGRLRFSGAYSSCRSVAEFHRAAWQCFLGMEADLLENKISFCPRLPSEWKEGSAEIALGLEGSLLINVSWSEERSGERSFVFSAKGSAEQSGKGKKGGEKDAALEILVFFDGQEKRFSLLNSSQECKHECKHECTGKIYKNKKGLDFAKPLCLEADWKKPECLLQKNFLAEIALRQEFNSGHPSSLTAIRG